MSAVFSRCLWGRNEWVTNEPQRTSNLEPLCQQYTCVWPHPVRKWRFQACSVLVILNKAIVLSNSNNGNVMASRCVRGYHAHFKIQDREKGTWSNGLLVVCFGSCFWQYVDHFLCLSCHQWILLLGDKGWCCAKKHSHQSTLTVAHPAGGICSLPSNHNRQPDNLTERKVLKDVVHLFPQPSSHEWVVVVLS